MKKSIFLFFFLSIMINLSAQVRLDVEGDAKIVGKIDLIQAVGDSSIFIGANAGKMDDGNNKNTFVGNNAGAANTEGSLNSFFGFQAGFNNTTGNINAFFGMNAGVFNTTGSLNSFFGFQAGFNNTTGNDNAFFGYQAGVFNTTGYNNAFFGNNTGAFNTTGSDNSFFGYFTGASNKKGTKNTMLGRSADVGMDSLDRAIAIGYNAMVDCHACAVIGGTGADAVKVGIGMSAPASDLHIKQSENATTGTGTGGITVENSSDDDKWKIYHSGLFLSFAENTGPISATAVRRSYIQNVTGAYVRADGMANLRSRNSSRVKENILDKLVELPVRLYSSSSPRNKTKKNLDFNVLEVQRLFPEVVREAEDGSLGMAYADFGILAIKAIQELATGMVVLEKEKDGLAKEVATQNKTITNLMKKATNQQQQLKGQQAQIDELKSLVEKLLTQNAVSPKSSSYVLPLTQNALLAQNQPNPFHENTLVDYFVPANVRNAPIQVTSLDGKVLGKVTITETGKGQVTIQSRSYPVGTYFYSLVLDGQVMETKRMVLTR